VQRQGVEAEVADLVMMMEELRSSTAEQVDDLRQEAWELFQYTVERLAKQKAALKATKQQLLSRCEQAGRHAPLQRCPHPPLQPLGPGTVHNGDPVWFSACAAILRQAGKVMHQPACPPSPLLLRRVAWGVQLLRRKAVAALQREVLQQWR
jgi:hypothetical protein